MDENSLIQNYYNSKKVLFSQTNPHKLAHTGGLSQLIIIYRSRNVEDGRLDGGVGRFEPSRGNG
jgi:hypothetical protein